MAAGTQFWRRMGAVLSLERGKEAAYFSTAKFTSCHEENKPDFSEQQKYLGRKKTKTILTTIYFPKQKNEMWASHSRTTAQATLPDERPTFLSHEPRNASGKQQGVLLRTEKLPTHCRRQGPAAKFKRHIPNDKHYCTQSRQHPVPECSVVSHPDILPPSQGMEGHPLTSVPDGPADQLAQPPPSPRLLTCCHRPVEDSIKQYLQALLLGLL